MMQALRFQNKGSLVATLRRINGVLGYPNLSTKTYSYSSIAYSGADFLLPLKIVHREVWSLALSTPELASVEAYQYPQNET